MTYHKNFVLTAPPSLISPHTLPLEGYTRWNSLKAYVPFCRETLRKLELSGRFPKRIHLSKRCAAWPNRELHRYLADPIHYRVQTVE